MKKRTSRAAVRPFNSQQTAFLSRSAGFTVIELMISLVLLAISAALALPSYRDMIEKRQLTQGAEQIMAFINSAQLEAARQNDFVTISWSRTASDNWCIGTTVGEDACDCAETNPTETDFCAINATQSVISNMHVGSHEMLQSISGDADYTFDPIRGIFDDFTDPLTIEMSSNNQGYALNLVVNQAGQATLCSRDSNHSIPGYTVCPVTESEESEPESS